MLAIPILVAAFGACVCAAPPAASRTARLDGVLSLSADLKVQRNGSVRVKETIIHDFEGALFQDGDLREDANGTDATLLIAVKLPRDGVTVQPPEYLPPLKDPTPIIDQSEFEGPFEKAEFWRPTGVTLVIVIAAMAVVAIIWLILGPRRGRGRRTSAESMRPPGGLRPAAAALLLTGRTTALDFAATILDLARRGHLGIDVQDPSYRRWRLVPLAELGSDAEEAEEYEEYERTLLAALFQANDVVMLDELRYSGFRAASSEIRRQIVGSAVRQGRLRWIPDDLRRVFVLLPAGIGPILVSTLLFGSPAALSAIGGIIGATAMLAAAIVISVMGYRAVPCTAAGTELRREIMAYWHHLAGADMSPDEALEHLPYAVAFGHAALWQRHLDAAGAIATDPVRLGDRRALAGIDVLIGGGLNSFVRGAQLAMPPPAAFPASLASHIHGEWR